MGRACVEVPDHPNQPDALLKALASARVHGRESPRRVHLISTWAKIRKRLPGALDVESWKESSSGSRPLAGRETGSDEPAEARPHESRNRRNSP